MDTLLSLLQTYSGRDKLMRTSGYVATLLTSSVKGDSSKRLTAYAKQISNARVVLRLFDDLPMWRITSKWSADEKDVFARILSIIANLSSQVFYLCEHTAWSSDQGILPFTVSKNWWTASTLCWAISLFCSLIKCVRKIYLLRKRRENLKKQRQLESPDKSDAAEAGYRSAIRASAEQEIDEYWGLLKNAADFMVAINGLPWRPFLWAGKFTPPRNAVFGTISSVVGVYMIVKAQNKAKKE